MIGTRYGQHIVLKYWTIVLVHHPAVLHFGTPDLYMVLVSEPERKNNLSTLLLLLRLEPLNQNIILIDSRF